MLHFTLVMENTVVVATASEMEDDGIKGYGSVWNATIFDTLTGKTVKKDFTQTEMGAILALAIGGEEYAFIPALYEIAEPAMKDIPTECRLIP